jgi:hypothetical protein
MGNYYVYAHKTKSTGDLFYIGKGSDRRAYTSKGRNTFWRAINNKYGFVVEIIKDGLTEQEAFDFEKQMIKEARAAGARLANMTDGGEGMSGFTYVMSEDHKAKIGAANSVSLKGRKQSEESINKRMESSKDIFSSSEWREKVGAASKKAFQNPVIKEKHKTAIIKSWGEKTIRDKHALGVQRMWENSVIRQKHKEAMRNITNSPEWKVKMSLALKGKKHTAEHSAKIAASLRLYNARRREEKQAAAAAACYTETVQSPSQPVN